MINVTMDYINTLPREEVAKYVNFNECVAYTSSLRETILILLILLIIFFFYNIYLTIKKEK